MAIRGGSNGAVTGESGVGCSSIQCALRLAVGLRSRMRRMDGGILCPLTSRKMRSMVVSLRGPMQHLQSRNGTPRRQGARNLTTNLENNRVAVGERATVGGKLGRGMGNQVLPLLPPEAL